MQFSIEYLRDLCARYPNLFWTDKLYSGTSRLFIKSFIFSPNFWPEFGGNTCSFVHLSQCTTGLYEPTSFGICLLRNLKTGYFSVSQDCHTDLKTEYNIILPTNIYTNMSAFESYVDSFVKLVYEAEKDLKKEKIDVKIMEIENDFH